MSLNKSKIKLFLNRITGNKLFKHKLPQNNEVNKILIISLYFTGDVLFHTAPIQALSGLFPDAKIDVWLKSGSRDLLKNDPRINKIILFDNIKTAGYRDSAKFNLKKTISFVKELKKSRYDLIIDLTGKYSTALITLFAKPKYSIGINYNYFGFCYDKFVYLNTASEKGHLIDKYLSVIKLGLKIKETQWENIRNVIKTKPYIYPDQNSIDKINIILNERKLTTGNYITIHLTSGWDAKMLPANTFAEVISYLEINNIQYLFFGNSLDKERSNEICSFLNDQSGAIKLRFIDLKFNESAELIRRSSLFIGSDSAPLHIAGAYEVPSIGLFGPTNPLFSNPVAPKHKYIYHKLFCSASVDKQYCTRNGGFSCPVYDCMNLITSKEIIDLVNEMTGTKAGIVA